MHPTPPRRAQRGLTLVEALIGFLVLSLGALGATRLQSSLRLDADISRQRTEAMGVAQQRLEALRATASREAYAEIADTQDTTSGSNADFRLSQRVRGEAPWKATAVTVSWNDRRGQRHLVSFDTGVAGTAPVYSALLTLPPQDRSIATPRRLPWGSRPFGTGQAAFKPSAQGTSVWLFNAATGEVSAICSVPAGTLATALAGLDPAGCAAVRGSLLAGFVRFSLASPPDAAQPADEPLPFGARLTLDPVADATPATPTPLCETDEHPGADEPYTAYACVIPLASASAGWSGRLEIVPAGWALGSGPDDHKVCRYSDDHDGSGRVDRNDENPGRYTGVTGPLLQQNYLVIRGDQACPAALRTHNAASVATVQHQP